MLMPLCRRADARLPWEDLHDDAPVGEDCRQRRDGQQAEGAATLELLCGWKTIVQNYVQVSSCVRIVLQHIFSSPKVCDTYHNGTYRIVQI